MWQGYKNKFRLVLAVAMGAGIVMGFCAVGGDAVDDGSDHREHRIRGHEDLGSWACGGQERGYRQD